MGGQEVGDLTPPPSPIVEESEFVRRNLPRQEQSVFRIRYFTKNTDTGAHEEIRPLTGSKWNLAPHNKDSLLANPYRTFDNQPIYKVILILIVPYGSGMCVGCVTDP